MVTVEVDPVRVEIRLAAGEICCPACDVGVLARWGWARWRRVAPTGEPVRPRRARCRGCGVTHVLLPVTLLLRRAYAAPVIWAAFGQRAAGLGHRRIATDLGLVAATVRGNYRGFTSHRRLAQTAGDLLADFTVSTKVGFFPGPDGHTVHSLAPEQLRPAVEQSCEDLGRTPEVVFLHNPERTLADLSTDEGGDRLAGACAYLAEAVATGLCAAWGIPSWDPRPLVNVLAASKPDRLPTVLLVRAGLTVHEAVLTAAEEIGEVFGISAAGRWGMSPFEGSTAGTVWRTTNLSALLTPQQPCSTTQAAFRLAYELPAVTRIAVGTGNTAHLTELVAATDVDVAADAINQYRELIRADT